MKDDPMNRTKVLRGSDLPQAKLSSDDVRLIRELVDHRESLKREAKSLTNSAIAEKFNVHRRTIERITSEETWLDVQ